MNAEQWRKEAAAFLQANGINPGDVLLGATINVTDDIDGATITTRVVVRDSAGRLRWDVDRRPLTREVTVPMISPPPWR